MDTVIFIFLNQTIAHPALDLFFAAVSWAAIGILPGIGAALAVSKRRRVGLALLAALALGLALTMLFQYLALRPRPVDARLVLPMPNFPSYPSGHAVAAFATATILALAHPRPAVRAGSLMAAALISLSRVYLGHHYPSDILGGAVLGSAVGATCYGLIAGTRSALRWRSMFWLQLAIVFVVTQMAYLNILPAHLLRWPMADKVLHFLLFGAVAFWLNLYLEGRSLRVMCVPVPLAILIPFVMAALEEILQSFSPLRTASAADLGSDLAGLLIFWRASQKLAVPRAHAPSDSGTIANIPSQGDL